VNEGERGGVDDISEKGPFRNPFFWPDFVTFVKFKIVVMMLSMARMLV
jgi:hypothetical protein